MNKIEVLKAEKDGLDILNNIPAFSKEGWESIPADDRDRLKWAGIFFRRQTPGRFMMRIRISNGISNSGQFRAIAGISDDYGKGFADLTTRQQIQLREFSIEQVPDIWQRLDAVGLISLQTGMDNIRTVVGCPAAGLTPHELMDASPIARQFTDMFVGNREYTNLPRKFNVTITGCLENCTHVATQDIAMTPAVKTVNGREVAGFNVAAGGKMGSGGYTPNTPLDLFVTPDEAAEICNHIVLIFRDHGSREARNKVRLAFLIAEWGAERFRAEIETQAGRPLLRAGRSATTDVQTSHIGIFPQIQPGLNYVGLCVPVGRITTAQLRDVADLADDYGDGEIRITPEQNLIIPNVPDEYLDALTAEPLLQALSYRPSDITRGTVSCTGIDYCHFSLIETKERAMETARALEKRLPNIGPVSLYWSGCANGCANHALADIGLVGKRIRVDGEILEAVDIYRGGEALPNGDGKPPAPVMSNVACSELPRVLEEMLARDNPSSC
ncbi:MAG: ferredoxin--nitrite reductase [Chloroflexi bacterium]|nr:ferredoxin--nitrite reductase [Chloroflexota bacterium]